MHLKAANWSEPHAPSPKANKMGLANLLGPQERGTYPPQHGQHSPKEDFLTSGTSRRADENHLEVNDSSDESLYTTPSPSGSAKYYGDTDGQSEGYNSGSAPSPSMPLNSDIILRRSNQQLRSATIYSRQCRQGGARPWFGVVRGGRHCCTYRDPHTNLSCSSWKEGYTTSHDLWRHADAEHGPDEVVLIESGHLAYKDAQWIKSPEQLNAIKRVGKEMFCEECGMRFTSRRQDSKERHRKRGACIRRQAKKRNSDFVPAENYPKRKGGKTSPTNKRR